MEIKTEGSESPGEILLVDKPKGITSFDVIRILRKKTGKRKMGHAGTLDPFASGLMIIGVDGGTKRMTEFLKLPKVYVADILLGKQTDTGDTEGRVISEKDAAGITDEQIRETIARFSGKHNLAVPMYSAIKINGQPLYKLARKVEKGRALTEKEQAVVPPKKEMEVQYIKLLGIERTPTGVLVRAEIGVTSGSYIRTLAEEFGRRLDIPAMLTDLRRISIGEYTLENAVIL